MDEEWIDWYKHTPPEDIKGILIKYEDGFIDSDRYDFKTKKKKYRDCKILGWKFMERGDPNRKTVQCKENPIIRERKFISKEEAIKMFPLKIDNEEPYLFILKDIIPMPVPNLINEAGGFDMPNV